jgi:hypothetical protein
MTELVEEFIMGCPNCKMAWVQEKTRFYGRRRYCSDSCRIEYYHTTDRYSQNRL